MTAAGGRRIRVLVVDDSALVRSLLTQIIDRQPDLECVGAAGDPLIAREMIRKLDPDVLTLDVEMPRMDGLDFLGRLMRLRPMPVVMVSTLTERGADVTLQALELGAVDFVAKPRIGVAGGLEALADEIVEKIRIASHARLRAPRRTTAAPAAGGAPAPREAVAAGGAVPAQGGGVRRWLTTEKLVFIGASTGGTEATREVLAHLPADFPAVLVTQHMPAGFTRSYAARLDSLCRIAVKEAVNGERILPGHAYIAPGGLHLSVERSGANYVARVDESEPVNRHRPSVEVLFRSAARVVGPNAIGVMLTGMGADGAKAMREMRDAGSWNLAQDEKSCVIFGMPREAIAHGAAHEVLALSAIGPRLVERIRSGRAGVPVPMDVG
ncbi:MAG TPA: chemotaxis response regulator protein-glutamate methylesterase [Zeimonas sp.]|nr:chemotaxis response regulator protein-glutamate methylesterase [Zeimonas sp.]